MGDEVRKVGEPSGECPLGYGQDFGFYLEASGEQRGFEQRETWSDLCFEGITTPLTVGAREYKQGDLSEALSIILAKDVGRWD